MAEQIQTQVETQNTDSNADPFAQADAAVRSGDGFVDDMVDVRDTPMDQAEYDRHVETLAARKTSNATGAKPDGASVVPLNPAAQTPAQTAAAIALGKYNLSAEQAARLEKMFPEGMELDKALELLETSMKGGNSLFSSINRSVEQKRQEAAAIRKQGMAELQQAKALKQQAEELIKRIGGGQQQADPRAAQQTQQMVADLDPNDPFHKPLIPLYQTIQSLQNELRQMREYKDPYTSQQISTGFQKLQAQMGDRFSEAVANFGQKYGLKQNEVGEYDLNQLDAGSALALQQEIVAHTESVRQHGERFDTWYADATKDLPLLPKSSFMSRAFWAQVAEDIDNGVQASPERFRQLALQMENELRSGVQSLATQQAAVRESAGNPVVSTAGAATSASVEGADKPYDFNAQGGDIFDHVHAQLKPRILNKTRR